MNPCTIVKKCRRPCFLFSHPFCVIHRRMAEDEFHVERGIVGTDTTLPSVV